MATTQKEYKMLWTLAVALGNNFNATFQNAAKQLDLLNQRQKELSKTQENVTSWQKYSDKAQETWNTLERLRAKLADVTVEYNASGRKSKEYASAIRDLEKQIKGKEEELQKDLQKMQEYRDAAQASGVSSNQYTLALRELQNELERVNKEQDEYKRQMEETADATNAANEAIAAAAIKDKLFEYANAMKECVVIAADFQESMSVVKALSSANADEMEQLTQRAKDLGAATKFTALEVGDAMGYMGMAGWSAEEMLSGIDGVMNLAAASGEDLAMVSDIITDNLTAFRLEASDTAHFVDVLAATATNANTNVAIMGETFKNSASIAGALGYSVEDMALAVGTMANAGIKGSIAGTSLRNIFNGLLKDVELSAEAFGKHTVSVVNEDGSMKSFRETISALRTEFSLMTESEKVLNAKELGGMRGYNGLLALINATDEELDSLTEKINNSTGAAQKMADIRLDNLNGDLTIMKSAWDAVKTTLGEEFNSELRELVQLFTGILHGVNEFIISNPAFVKGILAATAAFLGITTAITSMDGAMTAVNTVIGLMTPGFREIIAISTALSVVVGAMVAINNASGGAEREMSKLTATARAEYAEMNRLDKVYKTLAESEGEDYKNIELARKALQKQTEAYNDAKISAESFYSSHQKVVDSHNKIMESYSNNAREVSNEIASVNGLRGRLESLVDENGHLIGSSTELNTVIGMLNESIPNLGLSYDAETNSINKTTKAIREQIKAEADKKRYEANVTTYEDLLRETSTLEEDAAASAKELDLAHKELSDGMRSTAFMDPTEAMERYERLSASVEQATETYNDDTVALEENRRELERLEAELNAYESQFGDNSTDTAESVIGAVTDRLEKLSKSYQEAYDTAWKSVTGQNALWDEASEVQAMDIDKINTNIKAQADYWNEYNDNLEKLRSLSSNEEYAGLADVISSFADGSDDSVNAIAGLAKAAETDGTKLKNLVTNYTELIEARDKTSDSIAQFSTDFDKSSKKIVQDAEAAVRSMDLSDEATAAAKNTLQAYITTFSSEDFGSRVYNAGQTLRTALTRGLNVANKSFNDKNFNHYASGTSSAPRGFAMTGENGPELVYFGGGERVLNHGDTTRVLRDSATPQSSNVSVSFNIGGNADTNTVAQLQAYADDFAERVMDVINSANADSARRAYA